MNMLTIAQFTVQEAISRKLVLAAVLLSTAFIGLYALGFSLLYQSWAQSANNRVPPAVNAAMLTLLGLYAVNFLSGFLALFLSVGAISGEIDSGALHAVLARPMRRAEYLAGRWLAFAGLIGLYVGLMAGALLLVSYLIAGFEASDPLRAIALMMLGAVLLTTLSLLGSTIFSTLANGVVVFSLFGLGWLAGIIEFIGGLSSNEAMVNLAIAVSLLVPSDAIWRGGSYYIQSPASLAFMSAINNAAPFASSAPPAAPFIVWAVVYPVVCLVAAIATFSRRDL